MKHAFTRFALAALLPLLLLSGCIEQTDGPVSGLQATINFVALRQVDGQYQLGLDYAIEGNKGVTELTVYIDDKPHVTSVTEELSKSSADEGVLFLDVDDPGTTSHTVYIVASDAAGEKSASEEKPWSINMRKPLVEIVTSANCTPCAPANEEYKFRTESEVAKLSVVTVKYHVWWPRPTDSLYKYTKEWVEPRVKNYLPQSNTWVAPTGFVDGSNIGNKAANWVQQASQDQDQPAGAEIILNKVDNGTNVEIGIDVRGITTSQYSDLRLHTLVLESEIHYNDGNAEKVHYEVMKRMLPDAAGEEVTIQNDQQVAYTRMVDIMAGEVKANMHVVVFLQSESTKEVLQAATIDF